jgi:MFS family permease
MYSEEDLNAAVADGALSSEDAARLRAHVERQREVPRMDEESFRLVTSFNDVFVSIGVVILLVAVGSIADTILPDRNDGPMELLQAIVSALAIAATSWGLAEVFTRRRRMALPSIILTFVFIFSVFGGSVALVVLPFSSLDGSGREGPEIAAQLGLSDAVAAALLLLLALVAVALTVFAARLHWRRFMVPITIAVGVGAAVGGVIAGIAMAAETIGGENFDFPFLPLVFLCGLAVFAFAMRWDTSDRERLTRRSDVAFWLHLLAAPMIAHPLFAMLGVVGGDGEEAGALAALGVLALYVAFGLVALAIDRRALLVSALAYVLVAMGLLFRSVGAVDFGFALTSLVIGSALLTLSAFWTPIRRRVVGALPAEWQTRIPPAATLPAAPGATA